MNHLTDTEARFQNIELDGPEPEAKPQPESKPDPLPVRRGWESPGVSAEGAARAKRDEEAAIAAGLSVAPPIYEIGSLVNQWGVDNFKASREEYEAMPTADEACSKLVERVQAEDRQDVVVDVPDLRMTREGCLTRGGGSLPVTDRAITGIATHVTPGGGSYLRNCPAHLRAANVNYWCENGYKADVRATKKARKEWEESGRKGEEPETIYVPRAATLRTRLNHTSNRREVFAVVGPRYGAHDIDAIAQQVMSSPAIPADARADVVYDGYKARIDVLFHSNVQPEKVVAGEIFKAGIMLKTADDGSGSIQIAAQVWRNLCLNLFIIDHAKEMVTRRRHAGNQLHAAVEEGIADAMKKVQHFADAWSEATMEDVLKKYDLHDVEEVFRGLVYNKVVHVPNCKPDEMHGRLMAAWRQEPGYSKTAIVNAVTRAAHENTWGKWTDVEELESTGGALLFQPVWNVRVPEGVELSY